jgi:CDP-glycerol glycerophosphotransferase
MTTYIISSCERFSCLFSKDIGISKDKFLNIGMPRNDIFFSKLDVERKRKIVRKVLNITDDNKIVLYAPTFRGDIHGVEEFKHSLDSENVLVELKKVFRTDFIFLYRSHHLSHQNINNAELENCISVSDYGDIQELLCAVDVLITDYSSCMWDFSLTYKPCFIYAPDLKKYRDNRGFYTPIEEWPFPAAETNKDLIENIRQFDSQKYINDVNKHHADLGSYETGHATEQLCKILFE